VFPGTSGRNGAADRLAAAVKIMKTTAIPMILFLVIVHLLFLT
jgi:hypothetical protein